MGLANWSHLPAIIELGSDTVWHQSGFVWLKSLGFEPLPCTASLKTTFCQTSHQGCSLWISWSVNIGGPSQCRGREESVLALQTGCSSKVRMPLKSLVYRQMWHFHWLIEQAPFLASFWKPLLFFEQSMVYLPLVLYKMALGSTEHYIQLNHRVILLSNALPAGCGREEVLIWW